VNPRDRVIRALVDMAVAQLGLTLPVAEGTSAESASAFREWNACPARRLLSVEVVRVGRTHKVRRLEVTAAGLVERDAREAGLVHAMLPWAALAQLSIAPGCGRVLSVSEGQGFRRVTYEVGDREGLIGAIVDACAQQGFPAPVLPEEVAVGWVTGGVGPEGDKEYEDSLIERLAQTSSVSPASAAAAPPPLGHSGVGAGADLDAWEAVGLESFENALGAVLHPRVPCVLPSVAATAALCSRAAAGR